MSYHRNFLVFLMSYHRKCLVILLPMTGKLYMGRLFNHVVFFRSELISSRSIGCVTCSLVSSQCLAWSPNGSNCSISISGIK